MQRKRQLLFYFINTLSVCRLILGPIIAFFLFHDFRLVAFVFFFFAVITDFFDGYLARKFKLTSEFGRNCDGLADFSIILFPIISLIILGDLPDFFIIIMIIASTLIFLNVLFQTIQRRKIEIPERRVLAVINAYVLYLAIGFSIINLIYKPIIIFFSSFIVVLTIFDYFIYNPEK